MAHISGAANKVSVYPFHQTTKGFGQDGCRLHLSLMRVEEFMADHLATVLSKLPLAERRYVLSNETGTLTVHIH